MIITKRVCDFCGKQIHTNFIETVYFKLKIDSKKVDMCQSCMKEFETWIKMKLERE